MQHRMLTRIVRDRDHHGFLSCCCELGRYPVDSTGEEVTNALDLAAARSLPKQIGAARIASHGSRLGTISLIDPGGDGIRVCADLDRPLAATLDPAQLGAEAVGVLGEQLRDVLAPRMTDAEAQRPRRRAPKG